ncbi:MAG TPA: ABC transporter permease [Solirubrobacteraceae bacterium]|jgi:ABC-2 type transport system permease protein|nr:ABC transporter permease [Solirubrobacteraceae bacterium]
MSVTQEIRTEEIRTGGGELARARRGSVGHVYRVERRKLASQLAVRLVALVCLLSPFVFGGILRVQSGSPTDTLYGVWVHSSGFAVSLLLLAFAGSWGFPLVAGIVAGDMFSSEDRYGTWKLVLTRSCSRGEVFAGKLLASAEFTIGLLVLTAASSIVAGVLLVGDQALVSLSGTVLSAGHSLGLVLASWLLCLFPALAFASLGVLLSIATRNGIFGVIGPGLAALAMQLLLLVGSGIYAHMLLVGSAFGTWHALFSAHAFYGQVLVGILVSVVWTVVCLTVSWRILRKRDFAGTPVSRRQGWATPVRVALSLVAVIALVAIAGNWGPAGVTGARLLANFIPTFNNLTLLQQRELGRAVAPDARLSIQFPTCSRRAGTPTGPGEWVCTFSVLGVQTSPLPPPQTTVTYELSVQQDGCYKAQSPPAFVGQQMMRDAGGHSVVNPLFTIYGCLNTI